MVSVVHALPDSGVDENALPRLTAGLPAEGGAKVARAFALAG